MAERDTAVEVTTRDADGNTVEVPDAQTERNRAFFTDTVDTLKAAHREGWQPDRLNGELTEVQRAHGYGSDTPVLGGNLGADLGLADASVGAGSDGALGVRASLALPATRDVGRDLDAAAGTYDPASGELTRKVFVEAAVNTARHTFAAMSLAALSACSGASAADRAWEEAELPEWIILARVSLDKRQGGTDSTNVNFLDVAAENRGRCCTPTTSSFGIKSHGGEYEDLEFSDISAELDPDASFYTITLPNPDDTALIEPLFGGQMRRHVMAEPQEGCYVVSGVRNGVRKAGVIANTIKKELVFRADSTADGRERRGVVDRINQEGVNRCNISAILLLHGLPEDEAIDFASYATEYRAEFGIKYTFLAPDLAKIEARAAELAAGREE